MSDEQPTSAEVQSEPEDTGGNPMISSMMDQLRQERASVAPDTAELDVPGYSGKLVAVYGVVDGRTLGNIGKKIQRQFKDEAERQIYGAVDTLIAACEGLYFRPPESDTLIPIDPDMDPHQLMAPGDGVAATYSHPKLGTYFGFSSDGSARSNLFGLFKNNDTAIVAHATTLSRWMADTSKGVDESWLGR